MLAAFVNPRSEAVRSILGERELLLKQASQALGYQSGPGKFDKPRRSTTPYKAVSTTRIPLQGLSALCSTFQLR